MPHTDITNDLAFDLVAQWEDEKARGNSVSLEEICAPHPEVLSDVREIARRLASGPALFLAQLEGEAPRPGAPTGTNRVPPDWIEIGHGASSIVYRGQDPTFGATVAFKVLQTQGRALAPADVVRLMKRFEQEAQILARLKHDGIVRIFKTFDLDGRPVLEMEHLPNGSLATHLETIRASGTTGIARFMERVVRAVWFAHERRIVHRDLKPSNILLDDAGRPCVSDFGVAKLIHLGDLGAPVDEPAGAPGDETDAEMTCLTAVGRQPGTKAYMAPEQFDASFGPISPATDVWALGVILYELVNGTRPFTSGPPNEWKAAVCQGPPPPRRWSAWRRKGRLEAIALRCLARKPAKRYPSALAVADALAAIGRPVWRRLLLAAGVLITVAACIVALIPPVPVPVSGPVLPPEPSRVAVEREAREAVQHCATGKVSKGLFALAGLLERVPDDAPELRTAIRANIAAWAGTVAHVDGLYTHPDPISAVTTSRDGRWIAVGDDRGGVVLWDATTGRPHKRFDGHSQRVMSAGFSHDGRFLATGSEDQTVRVWPVEGTATAATRSIPVNAWVFAVAFTPDGEYVAAGTQWRDEAGVNFWSIRAGVKSSATTPPRKVRSFSVNAEGRSLVALNADATAEVWDLEHRRSRGLLSAGGRPASVQSAAYSPDGKTIATGGDSLQFWDAETGHLKSDEHRDAVTVLGFAANGESVAVRVHDELRVWQPTANCFDPLLTPRPTAPDIRVVSGAQLIGVETGRTLVRLQWPAADRVRSLPIPRTCIGTAIKTDGEKGCVAVITGPDGAMQGEPGRRDAGIDLWDIRSGNRFGLPIRLPDHPVMGVEFGPNRGRLAFQFGSAAVERPVQLVDVANNRTDGELRGHRGGIYCVHFLRTRSAWVTAGQDKHLRVWSSTGELRGTAALPAGATRAHVGPGERLLAVGCVGHVACVDLMPEPVVRWVRELGEPCTQVTISPDGGAVVALDRKGGLRAWAVADGAPIAALPGATGIRTVTPAPRGPGWITGHQGGAVRQWANLTAPAPDRDWVPSEGDPVIGIDPTGTVLITGTPDGKAQAWSITAQLPLGPPIRHCRQVRTNVWGSGEVITMSDKSVRVWSPLDVRALPDEVDLASWLTAITGAAVDHPLTDREWIEVRAAGRQPPGAQ